MSSKTAEYSFILQFSEPFLNRLVQEIFRLELIPTQFRYDDPGKPGLLDSRQTPFGRTIYQRYLLNALLGYDVRISNPAVRLVTDPRNEIRLSMDFSMKFPRELYVRNFDPANNVDIPDDPNLVDPSTDYPSAHETVPGSDMYPPASVPPVRGRLTISLLLGVRGFNKGHRATIDCTTSELDVVVSIELFGVNWSNDLIEFAETTGKKLITEVLRQEVKEIDVTALIGDLAVFDLKVTPPIDLWLARGSVSPTMSVAFNESHQVDLGVREDIVVRNDGSEICIQFSEAFFSNLISRIYTDITPKRFGKDGKPSNSGPIFLLEPRVNLTNDGVMELNFDVHLGDLVELFVSSGIEIQRAKAGEFQVKIVRLAIHPKLKLFGVQTLVNVLTFHILDQFVAEVLGSLIKGKIQSTLSKGLQHFLDTGKFAFSLSAPVRGSGKKRLSVQFVPLDFTIASGLTMLRGDLALKEEN